MKILCVSIFLLTSILNFGDDEMAWNEKKANFIGDSITAGGYVVTVESDLNLSVARNYGIGGSSLCYRDVPQLDSDYPPVISRWQDMNNDADVIFMMIGTNDYSSQVPLGEIDSVETNEFFGCLNIVLSGLKQKYPSKPIIISTILSRINDDVYPVHLDIYNNAVRTKVEEYNLYLFESTEKTGMDLKADYNNGIYNFTDDGLHPNGNGAILLGKSISAYMEQIAPKNLMKGFFVINDSDAIKIVEPIYNELDNAMTSVPYYLK